MRIVLSFLIAWLVCITPAWAQPAPAISPSPSQMTACAQSARYDNTTSGATLLVTGVGAERIYVCGYVFWADGTVNVSLIYGTGTSCAGSNPVTPAFQFTTQTGIVDHLPVYTGLQPVPAGNNLCINTNTGVGVQAVVYYAQF